MKNQTVITARAVLGLALFAAALAAPTGAFADSVIILNDPPRTVAVGSPGGQVVVLVKNDAGDMVAGANYRFETDPSCGAFWPDLATVIDGVTGSFGELTSPAFFGAAPSVSCSVTLTIDNVPGVLDFSMHVFSYSAIVMTPRPASVAATTDQGFGVEFALSESGLPIVAPTAGPLLFTVTPNRNGASGTLNLTYTNADVAGIIFLANSKQGDTDQCSAPLQNVAGDSADAPRWHK
jgi:hypothetical protein